MQKKNLLQVGVRCKQTFTTRNGSCGRYCFQTPVSLSVHFMSISCHWVLVVTELSNTGTIAVNGFDVSNFSRCKQALVVIELVQSGTQCRSPSRRKVQTALMYH